MFPEYSGTFIYPVDWGFPTLARGHLDHWMILCCGGCPVGYRIFSSIPGFCSMPVAPPPLQW